MIGRDMAGIGRAPRIPAAAALLAGFAVGIPGTVGLVLGNQISRARRTTFLPRPQYGIDVLVEPPWVSGDTLRVAFLGDSLVEGVGAPSASQSLPAQTAYRLAAHLGRPVHMRGYGITSSRIAQVLAQQVPQLGEDVDLVVVLVGANDATHGTAPWDFARSVEALAREVHDRTGGAQVVFTGLPALAVVPLLSWPLRDVAGAIGDTLHAIQRRLALRLPEARYIDMRCEVGDAFRRRGRELFAADGYHPNPAGYAVLGEAIARSLTTMLRQEDAAQDDEASAMASEAVRRQIHADALAELATLPGMDADDDRGPALAGRQDRSGRRVADEAA